MIILGTAPGERVMRPEFGCRAHELVFAPRNGATEAQMIDYVAQALGRWEPRINIRNIKVTPDLDNDGVLLVEIFFEIKTTHDQRSIVYPFYIAGDEG
jgi:phage baseplate assembly protein W